MLTSCSVPVRRRYSIGLKRPRRACCEGMSTPYVCRDIDLAREERCSHMLPPWYDVDDVASLQQLIAELNGLPEVAPH
jgi:hypothetical protein